MSRRHKKSILIYGALIVTIFVLPLIYGIIKLCKSEQATKKVRIALIQGNIDPFQKWELEFKEQNFTTYERLTRRAYEQNPELFVWPETAVPSYLLHDPPYLKRIRTLVDSTNVPLVTGSLHFSLNDNNENEYFNSAILILLL